MKQIFRNSHIKSYRFSSPQEAGMFIKNKKVNNVLSFAEFSGENEYCYVSYNSLTSEINFILSFSSDEKEDNLSLLFWEKSKLIVLDTGKFIYFIDEFQQIKVLFDITTPLIGLYLTGGNNLLVLEEASFRLITQEGKVLKSELFDLMENFKIDDDQLFIQTSDGNKTFELI